MTSYRVERTYSGNEEGADSLLIPGTNLFTGEEDFAEAYSSPTPLESDLLRLGSTVFAADRATPRGKREDVTREIELHIPVANPSVLIPLESSIRSILRRLSNDDWQISFQGIGEEDRQLEEPARDQGRTLLFSGGLDSFAAAIEFSGEGRPLELVGHHTRNYKTRDAQQELAGALQESGRPVNLNQIFVSSRDSTDPEFEHSREHTQRTRSFLFLILGALVARRSGHTEILYIAENGQLAIHLPLTLGRIGALSTHTAHPDVLARIEDFLTAALQIDLTIRNPFVHETKAEVVQRVVDEFPDFIATAESCWMNARLPPDESHCGECIPCIVRHVAIEAATSDSSDPTSYRRRPWDEEFAELAEQDEGRRNLADFAEFVVQIDRLSEQEVMTEWPSLYSENIDAHQVIEMYQRSADEAQTVFGSHEHLAPLFS